MTQRKKFLVWWIGGLLAFAIVLFLHFPLITEAVPGGIGEHQTAPDAATVNAIQSAWVDAGVIGDAKIAMMGDLIFIAIYGIGSVLGGLYFRAVGTGMMRHIGTFVLICGVVFLLSDYGETIAQFIQLTRGEGSDSLAHIASTLRPIKMAAWLGTFFGIIAAFIIRRFVRPAS